MVKNLRMRFQAMYERQIFKNFCRAGLKIMNILAQAVLHCTLKSSGKVVETLVKVPCTLLRRTPAAKLSFQSNISSSLFQIV